MKIVNAGITMKKLTTEMSFDPTIFPLNPDFVKYVEEVRPETTIGDLNKIEAFADICAKEHFLFLLHTGYGFTEEQAQRIDEILCPVI